MSDAVSVNFDEPIPLFPLPSVVLLPHASIPLHIFEPRYRAMTHDALDSRGLIAVASFAEPDWKQHYEGNPALRPHVCVGYIAEHHRLPDGRYNLMLHGLCRARILEELPHDAYRTALLQPTEHDLPLEIDLSDQRSELDTLLNDRSLQQLQGVKAITDWASPEVPTHALIDLALMMLCDNHEQRYRMLSEDDVNARFTWLQRHLNQTRRTLQTADRFGPAQSDDGLPLN